MRKRLPVDLCRLKPGTISHLKRHDILRPQILKPIHQANWHPFLSRRLKGKWLWGPWKVIVVKRPFCGSDWRLISYVLAQEDWASTQPFSSVVSRKVSPRSAGSTGRLAMNWRKADLVLSIFRVHPSPTSHGGSIATFRVRHISSDKRDSGWLWWQTQ